MVIDSQFRDLLLKHIEGLVQLQLRIVIAFRSQYPSVRDWEFLLDFPKSGIVITDGREWKFQKHGKGVMFIGEADEVVDIHKSMDHPDLFDLWRLEQYLISVGVVTEREIDEGVLENALHDLLAANRISEATGNKKMYRLR